MQMDGLIGELEIKNLDEKSYKLLKLGEIIGVGKSTVFGLGKIEIKEINCK
jgi:CRISPR/Cas system endoribonuclease Cas6 (RAMP superfamily)